MVSVGNGGGGGTDFAGRVDGLVVQGELVDCLYRGELLD